MRLLRHIPNLLSLSRIVAAFILLFCKPNSAVFVAIYIYCGVSDVLDGVLARRLHAVSTLGAVLDSISDAVFCAACVYIFILTANLKAWAFGWVAVIVIVRLISLLTGLYRFGRLAFLHTYANKATGLMLFLCPLLQYFFGIDAAVILLCGLATVSACEEILINIKAEKLNSDIASIFSLKTRKTFD